MARNRLAQETSPYLRQHQDNPVDWYPWGDDAFAAARARDVPVLLSVGYSACHWCHVMAHECFEDASIAQVMNDRFVNVKVDREERPDVDAVYMDAVQAMTGRGGWPMTVFTTPAGEPFYGGTYFPPAQFRRLMDAIDDVWRNRPDDVRQNVDALVEAIGRSATVKPAAEVPGPDHVERCVAQLARTYDERWGGFGAAPKFPPTGQVDLLLRAARAAPARHDLADMVATTLDAMASGGMYDHVGGGFARYSTDERWLVPHFEKMLSDQALLVRVYVHGAQLLGHRDAGRSGAAWSQVVTETVEYVLRDLRHPGGGFFSAEDADSPDEHGRGHEGLFHTWTVAEVRDALGAEADVALEWYGIAEAEAAGGHVDGRAIPNRLAHRGALLRPPDVESARRRLFAARAARPRPGLDDKVLTEWNALMLATLCDAGTALGRSDWLDAAVDNGEFLLRELRSPGGRWHRSWHADGAPPARHAALAADHAALVDAFTRLGEATGQARWIDEARTVADVLLDHFWDVDNGGLFTTADDAEALVVRQKELVDGATPSANSTAAVALARLAALTDERRYAHHADRILQLLAPVIAQAPTALTTALAAVDLRAGGITEVAVVGDRPDLVAAVQREWRPDVVLAWGEPYDSPLWSAREPGFAYVCRDFTCERPSPDVESLLAQLARPAGS